MDKELEKRALEINRRRQELVKELTELAEQADGVAEEIQELIYDQENLDEEEQDPDFNLKEHEAAYADVVEWQEALEKAAEILDV